MEKDQGPRALTTLQTRIDTTYTISINCCTPPMALEVDPVDSLYNRPVTISAINLIPHDLYQIKLHFRHKMGTFRSYAVFKALGSGRIDLNSVSPIRGTYAGLETFDLTVFSGVRPMGLFESLEPLSDFREGGYLRYNGDELKSLHYELFLYDVAGNLLDSKTFVKKLMPDTVERIEIEDVSGLRGVLFKPKGNGPFPTIMDILGTGGGISEQRGAALASEGFCSLVIAYFNYKDLTKSINEVEQSYFVNAVNWLTSQSFATKKIGLHGSSFGGILALIIAKLCPQIRSVVSINPPHVMNNHAHISKDGSPLPHAEADPSLFEFRGNYLYYDRAIKNLEVTEENDIHVEEIPRDVDIRFVASIDDVSTSSIYSCLYLTKKLKDSGHNVEIDFPSGGHVLEPPYYPHHSNFMAFGGEASMNGANSVVVWNNTLKFFKRTLCTNNNNIKGEASKL